MGAGRRILLALLLGAALGVPRDAPAQETPATETPPPADPAAGEPEEGGENPAEEVAEEAPGEADADDRAADLLPPLPTDADPIVERIILPAAEQLTDAAIALQNAVVRHCRGSDAASLDAVEDAFERAILAAGATEPHAFGTEANRIVPELLTTEVANTAFSRSRLDEIMNGLIAAPATLAALAAEEPGITGLPALERLLLMPPYAETATLANRCRLAIPIAARVRSTAAVVEERWRRRVVDPQWTSDEPELADRLRLRDLIQAMIDVSDRLDRDVSQFGPDPFGNERLPFASKRRMEISLGAVATALLREAEVVGRFAAPDSPARDALARVVAALDQGRVLLPASDSERRAATELFDRAQQEIAQLPAAFNFAPEAFQRPLASFEPTAAAPVPATSP